MGMLQTQERKRRREGRKRRGGEGAECRKLENDVSL
jgi:hypothetical protein